MKKIIITFILITSFSCIAQADIVVDTGTPTDCFGMVVYGWSETEYQWLAARFTLTNDYSITKIEGYFSDRDSGELTISIYEGSSLPNHQTQPKVFQTTQYINIDGEDWYGADFLDFNLMSGTYWVAFEPEIGVSTFAAGMPSKVPYPLEEYAYRGVSADEYLLASSSLPFGVRIEGTLVPVPAAIWLFGSGFIGLVGIRRKLKNT